MIENKAEIRAYYELNEDKPKEVAAKFKVKYRTLMYWIKSEKWEQGKFTKTIKPQIVRSELLNKEGFSLTKAASVKMKRQMLDSMGESASALDGAILNAMLDERSDKLLLEAMSLNFIQKSLAQTAIIAKSQLLKLLEKQNDDKPDAMLVAVAEKVANILSNLQTTLYGKDGQIYRDLSEVEDFSKLSNAELQEIIKNG